MMNFMILRIKLFLHQLHHQKGGTSKGVIVEQIIRLTGLLDPKVNIRPSLGQIDDLVENRERVRRKNVFL